jgi:hypothetical protein
MANHLAPDVAQRIVKYVAGHANREKTLYTTRHQIGTSKEAIKDKAGYSYKQLATALNKDFR